MKRKSPKMNETYLLPPSPLVNAKKAIIQKLSTLRLQAEKQTGGRTLTQEIKDDPTLAFAEARLSIAGVDGFVIITFKSNNILEPDKARSEITNPSYEMFVGIFPSTEPGARPDKAVYYGSIPDLEQLYLYCVAYLMSNYMNSQDNAVIVKTKPPARTKRSLLS